MQALKASRKSTRSQPYVRGSSEGTGTKLGVPDESTVILKKTLIDGNGIRKHNSEEENVDEEIDWVYSDEEEEKKDDDDDDDDKSIDIKEIGDEETDDEFVRDAEKTKEVKDDNKKAELPPSSSILSVSSGLDPAVTTIPDPLPTIIQRVSFLEKDVQELKEADHTTTHFGSLRSEIPSAVNAYLRSSLGDAFQKVLQKNTKELIQQYPHQVNYKDVIEESIQANVINKVKYLLPKFLLKAISDLATPVIQSNVNKALEKTLIVVAQSSSQAQSSLKAAESLSEYELKMILFEKMDKSCSYLTRDKRQALFDVLFNSVCLDDVITRGKKNKRKRTKESESSKKTSATKETSKGNASTKGSKSNKFVHAKESVVEPTEEVIMDASNDDVVNDVDQPQNEPTPKHSWFTQPLRPPTPDPE
ncbi:hypothetical protein Tco_0640722 [Tanacetum coccineum]